MSDDSYVCLQSECKELAKKRQSDVSAFLKEFAELPLSKQGTAGELAADVKAKISGLLDKANALIASSDNSSSVVMQS
jgi:hypothetical protein